MKQRQVEHVYIKPELEDKRTNALKTKNLQLLKNE